MASNASTNDHAGVPVESGDLARLEPLIREALVRVVSAEHERRRTGEDMRILLRELCRQAQADGLSAERLIILLKRRWMAVNDGEYVSRAQAQGALSVLVTACIEAYYEDARPNA